MKSMLSQGDEVKNIIKKIARRDFSGNSGLAIKNSIFQLFSSSVSKMGSLLFTIILARLLLPELFGLYSLALSTIFIFIAISDLGIVPALVKYASSALGKGKRSLAQSYIKYLFNMKKNLTILSSIALVLSSYLIAYFFYDKPIFLALIMGVVYLIFSSLSSVLEGILQSLNLFSVSFRKEIIFQITRIILVPIAIIFARNMGFSTELTLFFIFLALTVPYVFSYLFFLSHTRKQKMLSFNYREINTAERDIIKKFVITLSVISLSGVFFGYLDMIMLGRYVAAEWIGYYRAAFSLISSAAPLLAFSGALFPIFSRLGKRKVNSGFKRALQITILITLPAWVVTIFLAPPIIWVIYGYSYQSSIIILRYLAVLIVLYPITALYESFFISQGLPKIVAQGLIISTILNILLNYVAIKLLIPISPMAIVVGVSIATIFSRLIYLTILILSKRKL